MYIGQWHQVSLIFILNLTCVKSGQEHIGTHFLLVYFCAGRAVMAFPWCESAFLFFCHQEEMKAQLPRYQRLIPRPGQAHVAAPPVAAVGGIMPPQQGMPQQQPGMRHPMHGKGKPSGFARNSSFATASHCFLCLFQVSMVPLLRACQATCLEGCLRMVRVLLWCRPSREALTWA